MKCGSSNQLIRRNGLTTVSSSSGLVAGSFLFGAGGLAEIVQAATPKNMLRRPIPSTGELVPAIGMGTSGSFQVPSGSPEYAALEEVLKRFFAGGATLIDTAPTYGNAEDNLGPLLAKVTILALPIDTDLQPAGIAQSHSLLYFGC